MRILRIITIIASIWAVILISVFVILWINIPTPPLPPYGIWQSEEPNITLFIDSELSYRDDFPGIYVIDDIEIDVMVGTIPKLATIWIYENVEIEDGTVKRNRFFEGYYSIENDRLYIRLRSCYPEHTGLDIIIFELVEEVTPSR